MKEYEGIFILKPTLTDEASKKMLAQIEGEITKNGGSIVNAESWGRKNLAYAVNKNKEGIYYKIDFKMDSLKTAEIKKAYKLVEDIMRFMFVVKK